MKPITWIRLFLFCVVVGSFRVVEARDVRSMLQEKTDTLINPPLMKQGEQILRFDKTVLNIVAMIVVVVVMIFGVLKWMDVYTHHGETVVVPDVKGMTTEEAAKMFRNRGLVAVISDTKYVKDKAAGIILELKPGVGEKVKEGRTVYLTVNTLDVPLRVIPDVADNSSLRQAQAKLLSAGFKLNEVQLVNGEKDWVYGVKYQGRQLTVGEKIPMGASLTLMVGDGAGDTVEEDSIDIDLDTEEPVASESSSTQDDSWF